MKLMPAKPNSIIAHVDGSGTAPTLAGGVYMEGFVQPSSMKPVVSVNVRSISGWGIAAWRLDIFV
jgi:hypothetical protein